MGKNVMKPNPNKIKTLINKIRGIPIDFNLNSYELLLKKINARAWENQPDEVLKKLSEGLKDRAGKGISLDDLLGEAFAIVRETSRRVLGMRPFDVQMLAAMALHQGRLVEMKTGEGKTLAAVMPAYLNALTGQGVHILTFNNYLARRDAAWMGPVYEFLGLTVGCVQEGMTTPRRKAAYACDITYATAKEAGFDYLRDHICYQSQNLVHRGFHYAIVDEADSILIDEARVPLVIAGKIEKNKVQSNDLAAVVRMLKMDEDYATDEGKRNVYLTDEGLAGIESALGCGDLHHPDNLDTLTSLNLALHADVLLQRDVDYIVRNGHIEVVDEFTGRVVEDRHWPDGLQAAIEAKEGLHIREGGSILGSITLQHFLGHYPQLSGMTATAQPAANEFQTFYDLEVVVIPPNRPCIRIDHPDVVFTNREAKLKALIAEIRETQTSERPVLVGTSCVEESEQLAAALNKTSIACQVLNAKNDEKEAAVIAGAGAPGAVTISTNMAGRGTDIKLGGENEQEKKKVVALGGLYVIGTNRHESLRIDQQLRGRAGRQGDPGASRFFISLEDDLIERYNLRSLFPPNICREKLDGPINSPQVNREIARGQRIIEGQNFEIRKTLWNYSSLIDSQRSAFQKKRQNLLKDKSFPDWLKSKAGNHYAELSSFLGQSRLKELVKKITLLHMDRLWSRHLAVITDVRESIHLVKVGGESPLQEFQKIIVQAYLDLELKMQEEVLSTFLSLKITTEGVDLDRKDLKGPSSTWTYLINDNQFGSWVEMIQGRNIGFSAVAAAIYGPLYILWGLVQRFRRKK